MKHSNKRGKRMTKDEIEKKKKIIVRTFITIIAIVVLCIIAYIANDYIILGKNKTTNLVINNSNVTENKFTITEKKLTGTQTYIRATIQSMMLNGENINFRIVQE